MPKTKVRKKRTGSVRSVRVHAGQTAHSSSQQNTGTVPITTTQPVRRAVPKQPSFMNLVMAAMVALGCWGFAISYIFFTTNPDRYALGGLAILLALTWSVYFGIRLRTWQRRR
jgi:hypothetical protein